MKTERFRIVWTKRFPYWRLGKRVLEKRPKRNKFGLGPQGKTIFPIIEEGRR